MRAKLQSSEAARREAEAQLRKAEGQVAELRASGSSLTQDLASAREELGELRARLASSGSSRSTAEGVYMRTLAEVQAAQARLEAAVGHLQGFAAEAPAAGVKQEGAA
mmetsp:Transcript_22935/g.50310  ORF Transcript_22935/g.50310 Transcript_22935/m.50310 type:complete len:108 (+) Transcript_22935:346-669(+)